MSTDIQLFNPSNSGDFIKTVEDGIEYYTEQSTGQSGMSHSGLARVAGVSHPAIIKWVRKISTSDPVTNDLPECLKPFVGNGLNPVTNSDFEGSKILPDIFCSAMIAYYACFAAPKDQTQEAKMAMLTTSAIGLRTHIQSKTGWASGISRAEADRLNLQHTQMSNRLAALEQFVTPRMFKAKSKDQRQPIESASRASAQIQQEVLDSFEAGKTYTAAQVATEHGISLGFARRVAVMLWRDQKVERKSEDRRKLKYAYWKP